MKNMNRVNKDRTECPKTVNTKHAVTYDKFTSLMDS